MERVTYLLTTRSNPHAPVRSNGMRGWYYPTRTGGTGSIRVIGIHTTESAPTPTSARSVARWQAYDAMQASSYHVLVDSHHLVRTLYDSSTAFHLGGFNTPSLGLSFATKAAMWGRYPAWDDAALDIGAVQAAEWCRAWRIPLVWITRPQALAGARGFVRHSVMDPTRRSDPGTNFPAAGFFARIERLLTPDLPPEDDMPITDAEIAKIAKAVWAEVNKDEGATYGTILRVTLGEVKKARNTLSSIMVSGAVSAAALADQVLDRIKARL